MKIISGVYWDQGSRTVNQDSALLLQALTRRGRVLLMAVCDGIGGLSEGENASGYLTECLSQCFFRELLPFVAEGRGRKALQRSLIRCLYDCSRGMQHYSEGREIELGTTLSLFLAWGRRYLILHLGDSRIYLVRHKKKEQLKLLTEDHIDPKGRLLKGVGSFPFWYPDIRHGRVWKRSGILLGTDGFYRKMGRQAGFVLDPKEIGCEGQIPKRLREVASDALKKGEKDNLTAVYAVLG